MKVLLASEYLGQSVHSYQGLVLGRIVELIVDQETATLSFAVLSSLEDDDPGEPLMIVPWPALALDTNGTGLLLGISKERLKRAPALQRSELVTLGDREVRAWVLSYYGFPTGRTSNLEERRLTGSRVKAPSPSPAGERDLDRLLEAAVRDLPEEEGEEELPDLEAEAPEDEWRHAA